MTENRVYLENINNTLETKTNTVSIEFVNNENKIVLENNDGFGIIVDTKENTLTEFNTGNPGISAYQEAVAQGFIGTKQDWLDSLKNRSNLRYDFSAFIKEGFLFEDILYVHRCVVDFYLPKDLLESVAYALDTGSLEKTIIDFYKNEEVVGNLSFEVGKNEGVFTCLNEIIFRVGDIFKWQIREEPDARIKKINITLVAKRLFDRD